MRIPQLTPVFTSKAHTEIEATFGLEKNGHSRFDGESLDFFPASFPSLLFHQPPNPIGRRRVRALTDNFGITFSEYKGRCCNSRMFCKCCLFSLECLCVSSLTAFLYSSFKTLQQGIPSPLPSLVL